MRRTWLSIGLALLGAAGTLSCTTPPPRIPFDYSEGFHGLVLTSKRYTDDRFFPEYDTIGFQAITDFPGTSGWGWEISGNYASENSSGLRDIRVVNGGVKTKQPVQTERSSDFYELYVGTRQTFREGMRVQPYIGVGGALIKIISVDHLDLTTLPPHTNNPDSVEHYQDIGLGIYLRAGVRWNLLRDQFREGTEAVATLDVRALYGEEFSFIELTLGLGFGR